MTNAIFIENGVIEAASYPNPAAPPSGRLLVKRGGHRIARQIPKTIVLVDTREKCPFDFSGFRNWIAEEKGRPRKPAITA